MADSTIPFKRIPIKHKGNIVYALVDEEDYPVLSRHTWHLTGPKLYPATFLELEDEKRRIVSMHRMILGGVADLDHEDNVSLNNRKYNLRRATTQQNGWNKGKPKGGRFGKPSSQYKGVSRCVAKDGAVYWRVIIKTTAKGVKPAKHIRLGPFKYEDDAARAYNKEIVKLRGEWAWVNEITQDYAHKHPEPYIPCMTHADEALAAIEQGKRTQNTLPGYCPDCGVSRIPPFLKRCSRCCDTKEKQTEQARLCEENSDFYPTKTSATQE